MSKTNQILGKELVDRINKLTEMPHGRVYLKQKLILLHTDKRDMYLKYLESAKERSVSDE